MLDKELQALLKFSRGSGYSAIDGISLRQARTNIKQLTAMTALSPVEVGSIEDYDLPADAGCLIRVRVYRPVPPVQPVPALLYFHGGGFVFYDIDDYDGFCRFLAISAGIVVVAVNYRKAPEHRFPTPYVDAMAALKWLYANVSVLHIDNQRIAVGGDSVGGNLAAYLANTCKRDIHLRLQLLLYPVLVFNREFPSYEQYGSGYFLDKAMMKWFWDRFTDPDLVMEGDERLNPYLTTDVGNVAPVVMAVAEYDILRDEALDYYDRLSQQGNSGVLLYFEDLGHNFILFGGRIKACRLAIGQIAAVLRERLHPVS